MNKTYLYDGTYSSLLVLIENLIRLKKNPADIKSEDDYIPNLLDEPVYLNIEKKMEKVNNLKKRLPKRALYISYYVYLSSKKDKELIIYNFIKEALIYKKEIFYRRNLDCVNMALKIAQSVSREAHHMKGFLRFKKMNTFYYAEMSPTNNVIQILANHFKDRLKSEYFVIKDVNRSCYAIYDLKQIKILSQKEIIKLNLNPNKNEEYIEDLWKTFFDTIAIKERKNLRCQMNFMPKKYWKYIIEMSDKK